MNIKHLPKVKSTVVGAEAATYCGNASDHLERDDSWHMVDRPVDVCKSCWRAFLKDLGG